MNGNWPGADGISTDASTGRGQWDVPGHRRAGLRSLHRFNRYGLVLRAPSARPLGERIDPRIGNRAEVARCLNDPAFVGLIALRGDEIRFEACADDFDGRQVHSIQSISKMAVNLLAARCVSRRLIDLQRRTADYLPRIGDGYADATVRQLLDMNVVNGYVEDYTDPDSDVGKLECAHGWRIGPADRERSLRDYLVSVGGRARPGEHGDIQYKTANTDIVAWICERVTGQSLRSALVELIEQAGTAQAVFVSTDREGVPFLAAKRPGRTDRTGGHALRRRDPLPELSEAVFVSTDREGVPFLGGGLHMTLRDLVRLGRLFCFDRPNGDSQHRRRCAEQLQA